MVAVDKQKAKWQLAHHKWRLAVDAGNRKEADKWLAECDRLVVLFSFNAKAAKEYWAKRKK